MLDGGRAVEFGARLAHGTIGVDELRDGPRGDAGTARLAQARQVDGEKIHHAAQHRERKQDEEPVHALAGAHRVHGKVNRDNDVKTDSEIWHTYWTFEPRLATASNRCADFRGRGQDGRAA